MADNTILPGTGETIASDDILGVKHQRVKVEFGADGVATDVSAANPLPITVISSVGLTDTQLRATALPVSGTFFQTTQPISIAVPVAVTGPATDAQLRLTALPVSGAFFQATQPVSGAVSVSNMVAQGLTDAQLRLTAVPVSGTVAVSNMVAQGLTDAQLRLAPVPVSMSNTLALTDTQIRATALPVSGTIAVSNMVAQGLTDAQLRLTAVPVSGTVAVSNMIAQGLTDAQLRLTAVPVSGAFFQATQPVSIAAAIAVTGPATDAQLRLSPLPVSGTVAVSNMVAQGLTDTQLRATALPVSGTVAVSNMVAQGITDTQIRATPLPVSMSNTLALTDTQIRATPLPVSGAITVTANGIISTANSTSVALAANGVFTGPAEDITEFADVRILVFADQPSAVDGLQLQQSANGTNWDSVDAFTLPANTGRPFSIGASARFYRVVYTNGATAQTVFRLQTKLYKAYGKGASVRPQDGRSNENDFEEMLGFLMVYNGTSWDRARGSIANGLAVDVTRLPALVAGAAVIGATNVNTAVVSATTTLHNANVTTGLTLGTNLPVTGYGTAVLKITGTFVASFAFKISTDAGVSWDPISATQIGGGDIFTTATQPGSYRLTVAGLDLLRVEVTLTSGSITVTGKSSNAVNASKIVKLATSGLTIGNVLMTGVTSATTLSVANTAVTLTLPAPAAGQFHYITRIRITLHNTSAAAVVGSAVALAFTSTNLPGALAWTDGNALAAGTSKTVVDEVMQNAVKASTAATATTITAPIAGAGIQSRITAYYYTGP